MKPRNHGAEEARNGKAPAAGTARGSDIGGGGGAISNGEDNAPARNSQDEDGSRVEIGSIGKGRTEWTRVVVSLSRWRGSYRFDARTYVRLADGGTQATTKGINVAIADLPALLGLVEEAADKARALGILDAKGAA